MIVVKDRQTVISDKNAVEVHNLEYRYGKNKAVDKFSLLLGRGEILGLIGLNGAGKTTTLHLLLGFLRYSKGRIRVLGLDPKHDSIKILDRCGFFPEQGEPYGWMRIENLFRMGRYSYSNWDSSLCNMLSEQLHLDTRKRIRDLSKGMLVKTKLIFALTHRPEMLILDEPTNGLDPLSRYDILKIIKSLAAQHDVTVLVASHNLDEISEIATQICIINKGKSLLSDSMNNIKSKYGLIELSSEIAVPDRLGNQVIRSKMNRDKLQCLVKDKTNPAVTDFIRQYGVKNATLRSLSLKELFVFITRDMA
jgi:ABC-2 type transport system ATP-binding protein